MKSKKRNIVNYYELSEEWQNEATSNLDEDAQESYYLEPEGKYDPNIVLWDLSDCMPSNGVHNGFKYNAVIGISNNSAMLLNIDDSFETCEYIFV